eukprot:TRINITY_DN1803_c0_g1_i1.p1 TRINITY_DN1803_c0_g1~~TRINITY_DN1803_c0_g1_i1.p1  ORF type:complete len:185 (+),score=13.88 TRINITY_DN1803_c0_g1_i1:190-744(+)
MSNPMTREASDFQCTSPARPRSAPKRGRPASRMAPQPLIQLHRSKKQRCVQTAAHEEARRPVGWSEGNLRSDWSQALVTQCLRKKHDLAVVGGECVSLLRLVLDSGEDLSEDSADILHQVIDMLHNREGAGARRAPAASDEYQPGLHCDVRVEVRRAHQPDSDGELSWCSPALEPHNSSSEINE